MILLARGVFLKKNGERYYPAPYMPIGSIYLTVNNVNPSTYFGGTWEKLSGGYIYCAANIIEKTIYTGWGTQAATGNTGSTTLTIDQIPSHKHTVYNVNNGGPVQVTEGYGIAFEQNAPFKTWGAIMNMNRTGGGQGHTHTLNNHTHNIASIDVFMWKRIA